MDTFQERLGLGSAAEILFGDYLTRVLKRDVKRSTGFDREKDFIVNGKLVELKTDLQAFRTGRIFVEGISLESHTAPYVCHMLPQYFWSSRAELLNWYHSAEKVSGGDDRREGAFMYFPSPQFDELFKPLRK